MSKRVDIYDFYNNYHNIELYYLSMIENLKVASRKIDSGTAKRHAYPKDGEKNRFHKIE